MTAVAKTESQVAELVEVDFRGKQIEAYLHEGRPYVGVKRICQNLGICSKTQIRKIRRHDTYAGGWCLMTPTSNPGDKSIFCIDLEILTHWLASISPAKVKAEVRSGLILYQRECMGVLNAHFFGGSAPKPSLAVLVTESAPTIPASADTANTKRTAQATNAAQTTNTTQTTNTAQAVAPALVVQSQEIVEQADPPSPAGLVPIDQLVQSVLQLQVLHHQQLALQRQAKVNTAQLGDHDRRLARIEQQQYQATQRIRELPPPTEQPPPRTLRSQLNEYMRLSCASRGLDHREAWNKLYTEFRYRHGVDLKTRAKNRSDRLGRKYPTLDMAAEMNQLERLYNLACHLWPQQTKTSLVPAQLQLGSIA